MMRGEYRYLAQDRVIFGVPAGEALAQEADRRGARHLFLVSGQILARRTPVIDRLAQGLGARLAGRFDGCRAHTPRETVIALAAALRDSGADLVVTVGGGTPIDTVKVALACLAEDVRDVAGMDRLHMRLAEDGTPLVPVIRDPPFRQIALPTTLSGAEFSDLAGCTDVAHGIKQGYTAPLIGPAAVILDPALSVHTPEQLWLSTGIRAVDHAVESVLSSQAQPLTDATCLDALRLLSGSLRANRQQPDDLPRRLDSQIGVWLASVGINRIPFGASHGIGHVLGGAFGVPHGLTSCVLLPAVMAFNKPVAGAAWGRLAAALGHADDPADAVRLLIADLGLPTRLRDVGVPREAFADLGEKAMANHWVRSNPRPITAPADVVAILDAAW